MKTERFTEKEIEKAAELIRKGGLVAFPTETVYGLGANALDEAAVSKIYKAKGRPSDNPMIVHISHISELDDLVLEIPHQIKQIMNEFWPGPITFILKKKDIVPSITTGGLDTVAIRMPESKVARDLIKSAGVPIAAPSANSSGRPSPTNWQDVLEDMEGRIDGIIMGSDSDVGIESTVLDCTAGKFTILRPGFITAEMLQSKFNIEVENGQGIFEKNLISKPKSPGMKYKHYAPKADVKIIIGDRTEEVLKEEKDKAKQTGLKIAELNYNGDSRLAAHNFFTDLREADRAGVDIILVIGLETKELGYSVMNRMVKSAGYQIIKADEEKI